MTLNKTTTSASSRPIAANGTSELHFDDIPSCIAAYAAGEFLIVLDAPNRENEGDLIIAAAHLTASKCAFMIRHTSGYLCAPLAAAHAARLDLRPMVPEVYNADPLRTAYTISVDAEAPTMRTGISAADRALTAQTLADPAAEPAAFRRPGHVLPLIVREGGVRARRGHTEATWEFGRLAGLEPSVGVIGELVVDGEEGAPGLKTTLRGEAADERRMRPEYFGAGMMRAQECLEFGRRWGIKTCTIADLVAYVEATEGTL